MKPFLRHKTTAALHDTRNRFGAGVLVRLEGDTPRYLLGLRGPNCEQPCTWAPFGGMVEPGEDVASGAIRELREETGLQLLTLSDALPHVRAQNNGFKFFTFFATVTNPSVTLNAESLGYGWFTIPQIMAMNRVGLLHAGFALSLADMNIESRYD